MMITMIILSFMFLQYIIRAKLVELLLNSAALFRISWLVLSNPCIFIQNKHEKYEKNMKNMLKSNFYLKNKLIKTGKNLDIGMVIQHFLHIILHQKLHLIDISLRLVNLIEIRDILVFGHNWSHEFFNVFADHFRGRLGIIR